MKNTLKRKKKPASFEAVFFFFIRYRDALPFFLVISLEAKIKNQKKVQIPPLRKSRGGKTVNFSFGFKFFGFVLSFRGKKSFNFDFKRVYQDSLKKLKNRKSIAITLQGAVILHNRL